MATYTWIGGTSADWSDVNNWSSSPPTPIAPQTSDDVIFGPDNNPCTVTTVSTCRTLTINSGYNQRITLDANLTVGATGTSLPNTGIVINGTPTFTGSGWLTLAGTAGAGASNKSISSSANVEIYRLAFSYGNGPSPPGQAAFFSGSIIANNLNFAFINQAASWGFAPNAQFILRNKTNETALVTGSKPYGTITETPVPLLIISGSTSWESGARLGCNIIIASGSVFRLTGSLSPTYQTLGSGLSLSSGLNLNVTSPRSLHVNANATILCTTASFLAFEGGVSNGTWGLHMSGSTTNIWNALSLNSLSTGGTPGFVISSNVYLRKNTTLQDPAELATTRLFPIGSLILGGLGNSNYISSSNNANIYVGGSIIGGSGANSNGPIHSNFRSTNGGPKIIMYGTGHINFPRPGSTNAAISNLNPSIDLEISSSDGTIYWGNGGINNINHFTALTTPPTWSYTTAANYAALSSSTKISGVPLVINFLNRPIWDLDLNSGATPTLSSSLVLSGSLYSRTGISAINTSSLTSPSLTVLQNIQSLYATGSTLNPTALGQIRGNAPITMSGNLPVTYSLLVPINTGRGNNILIDKPGGNLLITNPLSGSGIIPTETKTSIPLTYDSGTFKWIAGTVDASNSTLLLGNSASMDTTSNLSWYNIIVSGSGTGTARGSLINIISPLVISNELNLGAAGNVTFTGSDTWTCSRLVCTTPGRNIILQDAVSNGQKAYRTTNFVNLSSSGAPIIMSSSATPTTRASWSSNASPSNVFNVDGIYIDSSNGNTIWTTGITQSTINWNIGSQPLGSLYTFFID